jgi:hypothetical protein
MNPQINLEAMAEKLDVSVDDLASMNRDEFIALITEKRERTIRHALYLTAQKLAIEEYFDERDAGATEGEA